MKRQKTTAELIDTGYWIALQTNQPVEIIDQLFKELKPTEKDISNFWDALACLQDYIK
jgi:hypothetical protein